MNFLGGKGCGSAVGDDGPKGKPKKFPIMCQQCGRQAFSQRKSGKFCSKECSQLSQRGRSFPHTPEWEERRLAAVRSAPRVSKAGIPRPREYVQPMLNALDSRRKENPNKYKRIAVSNLPKECSGEKNGNWRGGRTKESTNFRVAHYSEFSKWRKAVLDRDGRKCKGCGVTERLEVHHIISLVECPDAAFTRANGVTLCRSCHMRTDSFSNAGKKHKAKSGSANIIIKFIPQRWQDYDTVGNYFTTPGGVVIFLITEFTNPNFSWAILLHELAEKRLKDIDGITDEMVDEWDLSHLDLDDPGLRPDAPYHPHHMKADSIEREFIIFAGEDWEEYEDAIESLFPQARNTERTTPHARSTPAVLMSGARGVQ